MDWYIIDTYSMYIYIYMYIHIYSLIYFSMSLFLYLLIYFCICFFYLSICVFISICISNLYLYLWQYLYVYVCLSVFVLDWFIHRFIYINKLFADAFTSFIYLVINLSIYGSIIYTATINGLFILDESHAPFNMTVPTRHSRLVFFDFS